MTKERWRHRARSSALSKSDFATDCLFCRLPAKDDRKKEMMLPTKLVVNYQKNLHKHAHSMATGQTGRNCAQMHCTTASGTLTSEQQQKRKRKKAFRRSSEMQTAGPEDVAWAETFTQVVRYCAENNKQIRLV